MVFWYEPSRRALAPGSRKRINRVYRQARLDKSHSVLGYAWPKKPNFSCPFLTISILRKHPRLTTCVVLFTPTTKISGIHLDFQTYMIVRYQMLMGLTPTRLQSSRSELITNLFKCNQMMETIYENERESGSTEGS